jgi:hypothetical protein
MPTVQHTSVEGVSPSGFAAEDYEVDGVCRPQPSDLNLTLLRQLGLA